jgi:hypothetical protein
LPRGSHEPTKTLRGDMKKTDVNIRYHELVVETLKAKKHLDNYEARQLIYSQLVLAKLVEKATREKSQ